MLLSGAYAGLGFFARIEHVDDWYECPSSLALWVSLKKSSSVIVGRCDAQNAVSWCRYHLPGESDFLLSAAPSCHGKQIEDRFDCPTMAS